MNNNRIILIILCSLILTIFSFDRVFSSEKIELPNVQWRAMLDSRAKWADDTLYLPSQLPPLETLPINSPSDGWESLNSDNGVEVTLPMTMDEYFSGGDNCWTYEGVSWVWSKFDAPQNVKDRYVFLNISRARMRAEVYINRKLAAYDIVGETPFKFEVSKYIKAGKTNEIAIRLTNPGGRRGWKDESNLFWGDYAFSSNGKNFTTLGDVELEIKPYIYIDDIFVKNQLPASGRNISVELDVVNNLKEGVEANIPIEIVCNKDGNIIKNREISTFLKLGYNKIKFDMNLKDAELWSPENPALYSLNANLFYDKTKKQIEDKYSVRFGVRTFEVKQGESGGENYYLNGKRFFLKTAIDWGFYAPTGDYATDMLAQKSVDAAKSMGQNGLSFHRAIGDPLVMKYADEKGLCIYEEQGGFHPVKGSKPQTIDSVGFTAEHILEKIKRMVVRDRNHPSLIIYSLSNEDNRYYSTRREAFELINNLDDSRLILNTSGVPKSDKTMPHIRPYESEIREDFLDVHTAFNRSPRYDDSDFYQQEHRTTEFKDCPYFLGEVNSVTAPSNWYKTYKEINESEKVGYDTNIYQENYDKIKNNYDRWQLSKTARGCIKSAEDVSTQAGRGMLYAHARHAQSIMCNNIVEGFALNGWTPGPQSEGDNLDWASAIVDEGRNLKGVVEEYTYWTKPLQIALSRKNGKYFSVADSVNFQANLINQGIAPKGDYLLNYWVKDANGINHNLKNNIALHIEAGDVFAQSLDDVTVVVDSDWGAGYVALCAQLIDCNNNVVAEGREEVLIQNRASYATTLNNIVVDVRQWDEATKALKDAKANLYDGSKDANVIIVGDLVNSVGKMSKSLITRWEQIDQLLEQAKNGATVILKFDKYWAEVLYNRNILSEKIKEWGGNQTNEWLGNGWGYLTGYISKRPTLGVTTIGTTSWEVSGDPYGFYPFQSSYKTTAYGLYFSRPWLCKIAPLGYRMKEVQPTVAVTLASIEYGKGRIILNPCYWVDENNAFCDMLFFNMILNIDNNFI